MIHAAPAIHVLPKSRFNPSRLRSFIGIAAAHQRGLGVAQAVLVDGKAVALVMGSSSDSRVRVKEITHKWWASQTGYNALNTAAKAGQFIDGDFAKDCSGWNKGGLWGDFWPCAGTPEPGDYSGTNTARQFNNSSLGAFKGLNLRSPVSNTRNLEGFKMSVVNAGGQCVWFIQLYDRVVAWDGGSITSTLATMTNTLTAQRYISTGDPGLQLTPTVQAAIGAVTSPNLSSLVITDNAGNTAVTTPTVYTRAWYNNSNAGSSTALAPVACPHDNTNVVTFSPWIAMPAGVTGARKIETFTSDAIQTGTVSWAGWFPVATLWAAANMANYVDFARAFYSLPRIFDTACLGMLGTETSGNANRIVGSLQIVH